MEWNVILNQPVSRSLRILGSLDGVEPAEWNALSGGNPTVAYEFLDSLHRTGCAAARTGWSPQYPTLWEGDRLAGAAPLYVKSHSYGEYVFDWGWAEAYERHQQHLPIRRYHVALILEDPHPAADDVRKGRHPDE